jgi:hypothetical protein
MEAAIPAMVQTAATTVASKGIEKSTERFGSQALLYWGVGISIAVAVWWFYIRKRINSESDNKN